MVNRMEQSTIRVKAQRYFRNKGVRVLLDQELDMPEGEAADMVAMGYVVRVEDKPKARAYKRRDLQAESE